MNQGWWKAGLTYTQLAKIARERIPCKHLADMTTEEVRAIEKAYGAKITRCSEYK